MPECSHVVMPAVDGLNSFPVNYCLVNSDSTSLKATCDGATGTLKSFANQDCSDPGTDVVSSTYEVKNCGADACPLAEVRFCGDKKVVMTFAADTCVEKNGTSTKLPCNGGGETEDFSSSGCVPADKMTNSPTKASDGGSDPAGPAICLQMNLCGTISTHGNSAIKPRGLVSVALAAAMVATLAML